MSRPDELLARLRIALEAGLPIADDVRAWLYAAVSEYEATGESLEALLGLRGPGVRTVPTLRKLGERDALVVAIYQSLEGAHWRRCQYIAKLIAGEGHCPQSAKPHLQRLQELDVSPPKTTRGIAELLKRTRGISFQ